MGCIAALLRGQEAPLLLALCTHITRWPLRCQPFLGLRPSGRAKRSSRHSPASPRHAASHRARSLSQLSAVRKVTWQASRSQSLALRLPASTDTWSVPVTRDAPSPHIVAERKSTRSACELSRASPSNGQLGSFPLSPTLRRRSAMILSNTDTGSPELSFSAFGVPV